MIHITFKDGTTGIGVYIGIGKVDKVLIKAVEAWGFGLSANVKVDDGTKYSFTPDEIRKLWNSRNGL